MIISVYSLSVLDIRVTKVVEAERRQNSGSEQNKQSILGESRYL